MVEETRVILNHYNILTPFPTEWPPEKDDSDASDIDISVKSLAASNLRRSRSRYSVLERSGSDRRSLVPGSEKTRDGVENLVQMDEADPLGGTDSVVRALRQKGLPVEEDQRLRNRFLLSSTTFNPHLFLSQVHSETPTIALMQGLEYLSRSIDQKSASLKVLVESNFERFVRAKSTIDNVYTEMRNQGAEPSLEKSRPHSRQASRSSTHFRTPSGQGPPTLGRGSLKPLPSDKKKNALTKESEYGVQGIKAPLLEVAVKSEELWGPVFGGREREVSLKMVVNSIEHYHGILEVGAEISDAIKRKDYETLVQGYSRARKYTDDARAAADNAMLNSVQLTEPQVHQLVMTGRMWLDVEEQIDYFKREVWRNLTSVQANLAMSTDRSHQEDHVALISVLLELGVEDNPIWVWLLSRYDYLKNKINSTFERSRIEIEVLRRRIASTDRPTLFASAIHLKSPARSSLEDRIKHLDTGPILELWEVIIQAMSNLLSLQGGVLGEVIDFWDKAQSFIDGKAQRSLPTGFDGASRKHHRLSSDGVRDLKSGALELVEILREHIFAFFADPPIEDVSLLLSPIPSDSPNTPRSATLSPFSKADHRSQHDLLSPLPPSPKRGEAWEEFAFWPPYANSLSGVHYLGKLLALLGTAASEMASIRPVASGGGTSEKLKMLLGAARERSARAICAAWNTDAELCKVLEDWTRDPERRDMTRMPSHFAAFEAFLLSGTQKILYIPEAAVTKRDSSDVITPPSNKLLQMVRSQFVTSLYKTLSGMVENAERPINLTQNPWAIKQDSLAIPKAGRASVDATRDAIDASNRNLRMLLTLSNLRALRASIVPTLISQFETDFSVKLTEESKTIRDVLSQIDARLFASYTRPLADSLGTLIHAGISAPTWVPSAPRPTSVRPYVYDALLVLVYVHTEVSTTAEPLTNAILGHLLEQLSTALLDAFRQRGKYSLPALMQATLDVEFVAQTLNQYTTEAASKTQSQIYVELDKGTDNSARLRLQSELPEMRATLKQLREGTRSEFACFKRVKGSVAGAGRTGVA